MLRIQTFYPRGQPEARVATVPFSIEVSGACGLQDLLKLNMTYIKRYFLHKQDLLSFLFLYLQHFPSILFHFSVAVLWIRNGLFRIRSSFEFSKFRIRIQAKVPDPCGSGSKSYYLSTGTLHLEIK